MVMSNLAPRSTRELKQRLRGVGQRVTTQRLAVLSVFSLPGQHLTAEEICDQVEASSPAINRSTVYRTLERFRDLGLISETDLGGGVREYELLDEARHHHLICRACRHMIELDDELVEPLREQIRERYGFEAGIDHLALFGLCPYCAAHQPGPEAIDTEPEKSVYMLNH
jgi:Fur family transcriptional regulator, ferric uptake regulator